MRDDRSGARDRGSGTGVGHPHLEELAHPASGPWNPAPDPSPPIEALGERRLIAHIHSRIPPPPSWVTVGIGDDAAVVEPARNRLQVITTDGLVENVHFRREFSSTADVGFKALAVNLSDVAAMGGTPRAAVLALALPARTLLSEVEALVDGLVELAIKYKVAVVGGNITRSPGPLVVDVTVFGEVKRRGVLTRGGARPGDELFVSGAIGAAAAGLDWCLRSSSPSANTDAAVQPDHAGMKECVQRYLRPEPRVRLGVLLGRARAASTCIDLSDGLADAVQQVAEASSVGLVVEAKDLPIAPAARRWFESRQIDPVAAAVQGGEDYELLFTVPRKFRGRFREVRRLNQSLPLTRIGIVTAGGEVLLRCDGRDEPMPRGFEHF